MLGFIGTGLGAILVGCSSSDSTLDGTSSAGTSAGGATAGAGSTGGSTTGTSGAGTTGGSTGGGTTGTSGEPVCVLTQNVTRGPYFIDEAEDPNDQNDVVDSQVPERSDIRSACATARRPSPPRPPPNHRGHHPALFADATTAAVYGVAPYASKGQNSIQNGGDMVYSSLTNPEANLAALAGNTTNGYSASPPSV